MPRETTLRAGGIQVKAIVTIPVRKGLSTDGKDTGRLVGNAGRGSGERVGGTYTGGAVMGRAPR